MTSTTQHSLTTITTTTNQDEIVITCEHLDPPTGLPTGYPKTVEEMIRVPPVKHEMYPEVSVCVLVRRSVWCG
jgi:hypothetical protein